MRREQMLIKKLMIGLFNFKTYEIDMCSSILKEKSNLSKIILLTTSVGSIGN